MNMKKIKKFFTLSRRAEGFTLVELIVVIAILAILGGVAVPAYSGYVKKANMTADQTLVSEVANALTLYYYANPGTEGAYVILTPEGVSVATAADEAGNAAMTAVFGADWNNTTSLKYGEWTDDGLLGLAQSQGSTAAAVLDSSFLKGNTPAQLLNTVSGITGSAVNFISGRLSDPAELYSDMQNNMDPVVFNQMCSDLDIKTTTDAEGNTVFDESVNETQLANLMVLAAAKEMTNGSSIEEGSTAANLVVQYASYTALVNSDQATPEMKADWEAVNNDFTTAQDLPTVMSKLNTFASTYESELDAYSRTDAAGTDSAAIYGLLAAVDKVSGNVTSEDLNSADLYSSDIVSNYLNTYLAAAKVASTIGEVPAGALVIFLGTANGTCDISCSSAAAYLQ